MNARTVAQKTDGTNKMDRAATRRSHRPGKRPRGHARAWLVGALLVAAAFPAGARDWGPSDALPARCKVPDTTAFIDAPLSLFTKRLRSPEPVAIVVVGSGSAAGSGTSSKDAAFPHRLEMRLAKAFPRSRFRVTVIASPGQTAQAMLERLQDDVVSLHPALVILQTGSADAAGGIPLGDFGNAVEHSIALLHSTGSDVVLIDSQFSPRASLLVDTDAYRDAVRWNARRYDVPLFRRYDTMQYWWSNEVFDLDAEQKADQLENADRIHDCVAALLVRLIERGVATTS